MKQALTSAGVLALGAFSLCAYDPEMTRQSSGGPFTLSGTVRGFYDDNINTAPTDATRDESFGFQVVPAVHVNLPFEQTFLSLGYVYTLSWYDNRAPRHIDQTHEFSGKLRHQFNPRHKLSVDDSFVFTSEPTIRDRSYGIVTDPTKGDPGRTRSSVYHNYGNIDYSVGLTRTLGLSLGYANHWYDYSADGDGSRSALLDRIEHLIRADGRYQFTPKLVGVLGYSFGFTTFTGDELIAPGLESDVRDSRSHYVYAGVDYDITAKLQASLRAGAQFAEYPDLDESSANPYVDASLAYRILPGTSTKVGVRHTRNATDVAATDGEGRPTMDAETTAAYVEFSHQITRQLSLTLNGQLQRSVFNFGLNDGESEYLWLGGVNLEYTFNRHWSAEIGYSYDELVSNVELADRSYNRNRVYVGVTARY
jgi:predicted porin